MMNSCCRNDPIPIYDMLHFLNWYCSLKHQLVCPKNLQVSSHVSTQPSFLLRKKSWICMCHFLFRECHALQHWYNCDWLNSSKWTQFYANNVTLVPGMYYMYVRHFWAERSLLVVCRLPFIYPIWPRFKIWNLLLYWFDL